MRRLLLLLRFSLASKSATAAPAHHCLATTPVPACLRPVEKGLFETVEWVRGVVHRWNPFPNNRNCRQWWEGPRFAVSTPPIDTSPGHPVVCFRLNNQNWRQTLAWSSKACPSLLVTVHFSRDLAEKTSWKQRSPILKTNTMYSGYFRSDLIYISSHKVGHL